MTSSVQKYFSIIFMEDSSLTVWISQLPVLFSCILFFPPCILSSSECDFFFFTKDLCIFLYLFSFMFIYVLPLSVCNVHCIIHCVCVAHCVYGAWVYLFAAGFGVYGVFGVLGISLLLMFIFHSMVGAFYGQSLFEKK